MRYVDFRTRHGIPLITEQVADITDAERWPEINRAIAHARQLRERSTRHG
jgi:hypothetical protein